MGFIDEGNKKRTNKKSINASDQPHDQLARKLMDHLKKRELSYRKNPRFADAAYAFKVLLKHHSHEEIASTLDWYLPNMGTTELPTITSPVTFCERFSRLQFLQLVNQRVEAWQLGPRELAIVSELTNHYALPAGMVDYLPTLIHASLANANRFCDACMAMLAEQETLRVPNVSGPPLWSLANHLHSCNWFRPHVVLAVFFHKLCEPFDRGKADWRGPQEWMTFHHKDSRFKTELHQAAYDWCEHNPLIDKFFEAIESKLKGGNSGTQDTTKQATGLDPKGKN